MRLISYRRFIYNSYSPDRKEYVATACYRLLNGWKSEATGHENTGALKRIE